MLFFVLALVPAIVLHELSHGLAAHRMGDPTPKMAGRLTVNPVRHLDPFGSVVLPGLLLLPRLFGSATTPVFGYARPMPVDPQYLAHPERQMMWIALAGPLTNLSLAAIGAIGFRIAGASAFGGGAEAGGLSAVGGFLAIWMFVNVLLAVFNVMPIPPLDGSKVLARFLPGRAREVYRSMDAYGALFMLLIFFLFPQAIFGIVDPIVGGLFRLLAGVG